MSKHAKGPWTFEYQDGDKSSEIVSRDRRINEPVCIVPHDDITEVGERVAIANGKLIAAAPDLLKAAQTVLAGLHARIDAAKDETPVFDGIAALHDAINKATV